MRVTNQIAASNVQTNLNRLRSRLEAIQQQVSTGRRITLSSQDPTAGGEVMRTQSRLQVLEQWEKNAADAKTWVREAEAQLGHMTELLNRAREIAVRGANQGPLSDDDRRTLAIEVDAILEDMLVALNSQQSDGALFGGFQTEGKPFSIDMNTGVVTYTGDTGTMLRDVGPGMTVAANIHGERFGDWTSSDHMLTAIWQLSQDLKQPVGPTTAGSMNQNLANMDKSLQTVIQLRSEVGTRERRLEQLESQNKATFVNLQELLQQSQGVEMERAIIDLTTVETTYRAALQVGARVLPASLVDFLR